MSTRATSQSKQHKSYKLYKLTIAGGAAFWVTTLITSLLPIAAEYRAAFSNWSIQTVWICSLFMGIIISYFVSYFLLRFFPKIPTNSPVHKSMILSSIALVIAMILIDVPMILHTPNVTLYYFFIGVMFNIARFSFLGISIGCLYKRLQ